MAAKQAISARMIKAKPTPLPSEALLEVSAREKPKSTLERVQKLREERSLLERRRLEWYVHPVGRPRVKARAEQLQKKRAKKNGRHA